MAWGLTRLHNKSLTNAVHPAPCCACYVRRAVGLEIDLDDSDTEGEGQVAVSEQAASNPPPPAFLHRPFILLYRRWGCFHALHYVMVAHGRWCCPTLHHPMHPAGTGVAPAGWTHGTTVARGLHCIAGVSKRQRLQCVPRLAPQHLCMCAPSSAARRLQQGAVKCVTVLPSMLPSCGPTPATGPPRQPSTILGVLCCAVQT